MAQSVIIVLERYEERESDPKIVGVYYDEDTFEELFKEYLKDYYLDNYPDLKNMLTTDTETLANTTLAKLKMYNEVCDKFDCSMTWFLHTRTIQTLDYVEKIKNLLSNNEYVKLANHNINFYIEDRSGEAQIIEAKSINLLNGEVLLEDMDSDFWKLSEEPFESQKELYNKLKDLKL